MHIRMCVVHIYIYIYIAYMCIHTTGIIPSMTAMDSASAFTAPTLPATGQAAEPLVWPPGRPPASPPARPPARAPSARAPFDEVGNN